MKLQAENVAIRIQCNTQRPVYCKALFPSIVNHCKWNASKTIGGLSVLFPNDGYSKARFPTHKIQPSWQVTIDSLTFCEFGWSSFKSRQVLNSLEVNTLGKTFALKNEILSLFLKKNSELIRTSCKNKGICQVHPCLPLCFQPTGLIYIFFQITFTLSWHQRRSAERWNRLPVGN